MTTPYQIVRPRARPERRVLPVSPGCAQTCASVKHLTTLTATASTLPVLKLQVRHGVPGGKQTVRHVRTCRLSPSSDPALGAAPEARSEKILEFLLAQGLTRRANPWIVLLRAGRNGETIPTELQASYQLELGSSPAIASRSGGSMGKRDQLDPRNRAVSRPRG